MNVNTCIYHMYSICDMPYPCAFKNKDKSCRLKGNIKTCLVYIPKHIRKPEKCYFKNKYTLDNLL